MNKTEEELQGKTKNRKAYRKDINKGYVILYLSVFVLIVIGEIVLYNIQEEFSIMELVQNIVGNLMGVLAAFLIFDIAHEKISKDSYASEVSEQILDTLMYNPEALEMYENDQKKKFVNAFINSIVDDPDAGDMINSFLDGYLLTKEDFEVREDVTEKDCRVRTSFAYNFDLEEGRTSSFRDLRAGADEQGKDPYFYVQERLSYTTKYLCQKGNNANSNVVKIGFIYDNAALDLFLREGIKGQYNEYMKNCLFRENLDLEDVDKNMFEEYAKEPDKLKDLVMKMFRPSLKIDKCKGIVKGVSLLPKCGLIVEFLSEHDQNAEEHFVSLVFHMPKRWNTMLEVVFVEPTKSPQISVSYNEDAMSVDMYSFLNKGDASSYDNTCENENGVYSISINDEWVYPISGVVFSIKDIRGSV